MSNFSTFISSFNPQTKGKQFEVFVKWFLENDPVWKSEVDKVWLWDVSENLWNKNFEALLSYKSKFGDCCVPAIYKTLDGLSLGSWVCKQRTSKNLTSERRKKLDDIGFVWKPVRGPRQK